MGLDSPLALAAAAAAAAAVPCRGFGAVASALGACAAAAAAWRWWGRLVVTIDGVVYKSHHGACRAAVPAGRGRNKPRQPPPPPYPPPPARQPTAEAGPARGGPAESLRAPPASAAKGPADDANAAPAAAPAASSAAGFQEWCCFKGSLPYNPADPVQLPPQVAGPAAPGTPAPCWRECDAGVFVVRNIRYKLTQEKVPSGFALYDCVGMDLICDSRRIDGIMDRIGPGLPPSPSGAPEWQAAWGVPRVLIINSQLPYTAGSWLSAHPQEDGGCSAICYFVLSRQSCEMLAQGTLSPSLRLWRRFVGEGVSSKDGTALKVMGRVEDMDRFEVPETFHRFNNKPILLTKTATVLQGRLPEVMEIDYDVRLWVYVARSALASYRHRAKEAELEVAYVIEGKADDELPEQVLGCARLNYMDIEKAQKVSLMR